MSVFYRGVEVYEFPEFFQADLDDAYIQVSSKYPRRGYALPPSSYIVGSLPSEEDEYSTYEKPTMGELPARVMRIFMPVDPHELNLNVPNSPFFPASKSKKNVGFDGIDKPRSIEGFNDIKRYEITKNSLKFDEELAMYSYDQLKRAEELGGLTSEEKRILQKFRDAENEAHDEDVRLKLLYQKNDHSYNFKNSLVADAGSRQSGKMVFNSYIGGKKAQQEETVDGYEESALDISNISLPHGSIYISAKNPTFQDIAFDPQKATEHIVAIDIPNGVDTMFLENVVATKNGNSSTTYYVSTEKSLLDLGHDIANKINANGGSTHYYDAKSINLDESAIHVDKFEGALGSYKKDALKNYTIYVNCGDMANSLAESLSKYNREGFTIKAVGKSVVFVVDKSYDVSTVVEWTQKVIGNRTQIESNPNFVDFTQLQVQVPKNALQENLDAYLRVDGNIEFDKKLFPHSEEQLVILENASFTESKIKDFLNSRLVQKGAYISSVTKDGNRYKFEVNSRKNNVQISREIADLVDKIIYEYTEMPASGDYMYAQEFSVLDIPDTVPAVRSTAQDNIKEKMIDIYNLQNGTNISPNRESYIEKMSSQITKDQVLKATMGSVAEKNIIVNTFNDIVSKVLMLDSFKTNYQADEPDDYSKTRLIENKFRTLVETYEEEYTQNKEEERESQFAGDQIPYTVDDPDASGKSLRDVVKNETDAFDARKLDKKTVAAVMRLVEEISSQVVAQKEADITQKFEEMIVDANRKHQIELNYEIPKMLEEQRKQLLKDYENILIKKLNS